MCMNIPPAYFLISSIRRDMSPRIVISQMQIEKFCLKAAKRRISRLQRQIYITILYKTNKGSPNLFKTNCIFWKIEKGILLENKCKIIVNKNLQLKNIKNIFRYRVNNIDCIFICNSE